MIPLNVNCYKNMDVLILDVKIYIASFDSNVWMHMSFYDIQFKHYAHTKVGMNNFVTLFHEKTERTTKLFNKLHSINDLPALYNYGINHWMYNGKNHRNNDLPAVINELEYIKYWHQHGKNHRDNDLPAIMHDNGRKEWYHYGKRHRDNDLPAVINKYTQEWHRNGELHRKNDLPAVISRDGEKKWYLFNMLARKNNLPVIIKPSGDKIYLHDIYRT